MNGKIYFWCTGDHWSNGVKYNGMYCMHDTSGHDAWHKEHDASKNSRKGYGHEKSASEIEYSQFEVQKKKLALSESLCTALCSQVGLSSDITDRIFQESCRESGFE